MTAHRASFSRHPASAPPGAADASPEGRDTRNRIIRAAVACLAEIGYARTTLQVIAKRAGMTHGPLQYHFESKLALFAAVAEYLAADRIAFFAKPVPAARKGNRDLMIDLIRRMQAHCERPEFAAMLELRIAARGEPELAETVRTVIEPQISAVHNSLQELVERRGGDPADVVPIADLLRALAVGMAVNRAGELSTPRARAVWRKIEEFLLRETEP